MKGREPANILIARLSSIGDIILTSPVVRTVRAAYPSARISFLVKKEFASLVEHNPAIDEVIVFEKSGGWKGLLELRKRISNNRYDWFIDLHNNLRTNFLRLLIRFPEQSSYSKQSFRRQLLVRFGKNFIDEARPIYLKYFDALKHRGIKYDGKGTTVKVPAAISAAVRMRLDTDGVVAGIPLAVICPGASFSNKQWLPERFAETAAVLSKNHGCQVVFLGGPADSDLCKSIIQQMPGPVPDYSGRFSLLESAALLGAATIVITNDSGMMHLAQSQGTPVVAIFGPTTRELGFFPLPEKSIVIEKPVSCRPCTTKGLNFCPKEHFKCMKLTEVEDVIHAISKLVEPGSVHSGRLSDI